MTGEKHSRRRFKLKAGEYNWYKEQVAKDPDFLRQLKELAVRRMKSFPDHNSPVIRNAIEVLALEFDLTVEDIDELLVSVMQHAALGNDKGSLSFDLITRQATIAYDIDHCTDAEAKELLKKSLEIRRRDYGKPKAQKRRMPNDPELLYAIHRAVSRGDSRQTIFDKYEGGKLVSPKTGRAEYDTPADLMAYYYKHTTKK